MAKKIYVLNAPKSSGTGVLFYCKNAEMDGMTPNEVKNWFGDAKKITLENGMVFEIISIEPLISFTQQVSVIIEVDRKEVPKDIYPITAEIE